MMGEQEMGKNQDWAIRYPPKHPGKASDFPHFSKSRKG